MTGQSFDGVARGTGLGERRSLVLFPGALGDMVCLEPTIDRLRDEGPVLVLARGAAAEVAACFPARPEVGSLDSAEVAKLFAPLPPASSNVDEPVPTILRGFQRLVSFTGYRSAEFRARWERLAGAVLCEFPALVAADHASHRMFRSALADPLAWARPPRLRPSARGVVAEPGGRGLATTSAWVTKAPRPLLVIHPGAGAAHKRAPAELLRAAADAWFAATKGSLRVVLGPAELAESEVWRGWAGSVSTPGSVAELIDLLVEADAYLGNDSGPSHVAAALRPTAGAICYVSTSPCSFGPRCDRFEAWAVGPGGKEDPVGAGAAIGRSLAESTARQAVEASTG